MHCLTAPSECILLPVYPFVWYTDALCGHRWGQTYILEALMFYVPTDYADAEILAERIAVRLQHANSAVVLTSTKVILYLMNYIASSEFRESLCKKLSPPLGESASSSLNLCGSVADFRDYQSPSYHLVPRCNMSPFEISCSLYKGDL